jgi:ATP-dependent exoDNAse (exonuclease V) beta subunit
MDLLRPAFMTLAETLAETLDDQPAGREPEPAAPPTMPLLRLRTAPPIEPGADRAAQPDAEPATCPTRPDRNAAALGEALHQVFELIHDQPDPDRAIAWAERLAGDPAMLASLLRRGGAEPAALAELAPALQALLHRALGSETARSLLTRQGAQASFSELPLLAREGDRITRHIIDLAYRDASGAWHIVDYKTGEDTAVNRAAWAAQLQRYRELVTAVAGTDLTRASVYRAGAGDLLDMAPARLESTQTS